jgi:hypothetical protein
MLCTVYAVSTPFKVLPETFDPKKVGPPLYVITVGIVKGDGNVPAPSSAFDLQSGLTLYMIIENALAPF